MRKLIGILLLLFTLALMNGITLAASDPNDVKGSSDPSLFTRMPGYYINSYDDKDFDSMELDTGSHQTIKVEGHCTTIKYSINDGVKYATNIQILRNYANAAQKIGGKIIFQGEVTETFKFTNKGSEVWAEIWCPGNGSGSQYNLYIVQKGVMKQDVVADAATLASSLKDTGKVALYGIYFDTGKADVKPESQPTLQEIAKLLKNDPNLKLFVVGHTDNTGTYAVNMKLSQDRAASVVKVLSTQYGINASRLMPCGDGPTAPVASNDTENGRAQNRRVELVKQ